MQKNCKSIRVRSNRYLASPLDGATIAREYHRVYLKSLNRTRSFILAAREQGRVPAPWVLPRRLYHATMEDIMTNVRDFVLGFSQLKLR